MAEKSGLGSVEILLHVLCAAVSLGALIASAVTITSVNDLLDIFQQFSSEIEDDFMRYRAVAGFMVFVGIAGIVTQVIFTIVRALYYGEVIISQFIIYGILCIICTVLLALALIAGGAASAANAAHIQNEYIDDISDGCDQPDNPLVEDICDDFDRTRNSQAATAALSFLGAMLCGATTIVVVVGIATKRD